MMREYYQEEVETEKRRKKWKEGQQKRNKLLLEVTTRDNHGLSGNRGVCSDALAEGANPNTTDRNGTPVLIRAIDRNYRGVVEELLGHKDTIPYIQDPHQNYQTALERAVDNALKQFSERCYKGFGEALKIVDQLLETEPLKQRDAINERCRDGNLLICKVVEQTCNAVDRSYDALAKLLASSGANAKAKNAEGKTAVEIAEQKGDQHMVELLEKNRAVSSTKAGALADHTPFGKICRVER